MGFENKNGWVHGSNVGDGSVGVGIEGVEARESSREEDKLVLSGSGLVEFWRTNLDKSVIHVAQLLSCG